MFSRSDPLRRRTISVLALCFAAALALAGCKSAVEQASGSGTEVTEGGVLRIGDSGDLTPSSIYAGSPAQATVTGLVYDTLIRYPADGLEPQPALAESWRISPDGRTVELALRDDVTFHDGRPFTSEDVRFSLTTYADPARAGQLARTAGLITGYDTSDPHAVTLELDRPAGNILDLLVLVPIIDRNTMAEFDAGTGYNGTGAFRFTGWKPGASITFEADKNYWGGRPHLDGVEYVIVPDAQTQISQLRSGQLDLLLRIAPRDADALAGRPGVRIVEQTGVATNWYIGANVRAPGLSDIRLRRAIAYAVDRDRILADIYQGHGTAASLPWPEQSPAYDAALNSTYDHDIDRAKALVAEVGEIPVIPISYTTGSVDTEAVAQIVQADLEAAGLETRLEPLDLASTLEHLIGGTFPGLWLTLHTYSQYTPVTLPTSAFPFNAHKNTSNFVDADYRRAVETAWRTVDPAGPEAKAAYRVLNNELLDNAFVIELLHNENELALSGRVQGVRWSKKSELDLSDAYLGS
ncbi:ABC transporter substrate-binding protein [Nocardia sp. NPDC019395]|uniref:ABC transporter substrate-binding protein n=1 Tax=Nocardia sp. NPDC019395 TaxID=3154686 RepID=UPI0033E9F6F6